MSDVDVFSYGHWSFPVPFKSCLDSVHQVTAIMFILQLK